MKNSLIIIIFLILALIASLSLVFRSTIFIGKATGSAASVALENSYLFASPLQAKADGKELIRVTAFLLDGRGLGVAGKEVKLSSERTLTIADVQTTTDDAGKAVFDLSSPVAGKYEITAVTEGKSLPQKVKISFY